jgi:hypothetical protein
MVVGDLKQPSRKLRFGFVPRLPAVYLEEYLLRNLFGPRPIPKKVARKVNHRRRIFLEELLKCSNLPFLKAQH